MTRLNFTLIWLVGILSLLCYQHVDHYGYGRYFHQALETIHANYVKPVDRQQLFNAAVHAMVSQLDRHSAFITRKKREPYTREINQQITGGIGIMFDGKDEKRLVVERSIIGIPHPAHDAGIRRGDEILAIDGTPVGNFSRDELIRKIKGRAGESVLLTVLHKGQTQAEEVPVVRQDIQIDTVLGDVRDDDGGWRYILDTKPPIAYVRVDSFSPGTTARLKQVLTRLKEEGKLSALIIDVRDDRGGYLPEVIDMCKLFIESGTIVSTLSRDDSITGQQQRKEYTASGGAPFATVPLAVLINKDSASASEIFAACMQDHHRAVIIGERSYGKGSVQDQFDMENGGSILKLTTASYWPPSGRNIDKRHDKVPETEEWGVLPDSGYKVLLSPDQEKARQDARSYRDSYRPGAAAEAMPPLDPQLAKAVEYLQARLKD